MFLQVEKNLSTLSTQVAGNIMQQPNRVEFKTIEETHVEYAQWLGTHDIKESIAEAKDLINGKEKSRGWFMTCNNPTAEDWERIKTDNYQYICGQVEMGESGTPHIQFFIYYPTPRPKPIKKYPRCWIKKLKSVDGSVDYTTKGETRIAGPFQKGTKPAGGQRSDVHELGRDIMTEKLTFQQVMEQSPGFAIQYERGIRAMTNTFYTIRNTKPTVIWLYGPTGTGKSRYARTKHGEENCYPKDETKWWYEYTQQTAIIVDDFDGQWPFRNFLKFLDPYRYIGQTKCGHIDINSPYIYITSDRQPRELLSYLSDYEMTQVNRRIDLVIELDYSWKNPSGGPCGGLAGDAALACASARPSSEAAANAAGVPDEEIMP